MKLSIFACPCTKVLVFVLSVLVPLCNSQTTKKPDVCSKRGEICLEVNNCVNGKALVKNATYVSCSVGNFVPGICCKNAIKPPVAPLPASPPTQKPAVISSSQSSAAATPPRQTTTASSQRPTTRSPPPQPNTPSDRLNTAAAPQQNPTKSSKNSTAVALENCEKYNQYKLVQKWKDPDVPGRKRTSYFEPDCPEIGMTLVVNGKPALPKEYPHMALLGYGDSFQNVEWNCGGSLISENFILSAGHCSTQSQYGAPKWALLGDLDISTNTDEAMPAVYSIIRAYDHPNYDHKTTTHDIALFQLNTTVKMSAYVRPACLYTSTFIPVNTQGFITGWGYTGTAERKSDHLLKASVGVTGDWRCTSRFQDYNTTTMICAGDLKDGQDTCGGDSGGPLQRLHEHANKTCMWNIIGITSYGAGICGNKEDPSVFTNVAFFLDWIQSIVWP